MTAHFVCPCSRTVAAAAASTPERGPTLMTGTSPQVAESRWLRDRWRALSTQAGWGYPSDWQRESVDALCEAIVDGRSPWDAAERLGGERAAAAVSMPQTLADIDLLAGLVDQHWGESLRRAVSLGWSERAIAPPAGIIDPLTGLTGLGYLQVRLGEVYRAAGATGTEVGDSHALVLLRLDLAADGLGRRLPLVLVAESLRSVFDGGETLSVLSDAVAVVLCDRDGRVAQRAELARRFARRLLEGDRWTRSVGVGAWVERLPSTVEQASAMLGDLSR